MLALFHVHVLPAGLLVCIYLRLKHFLLLSALLPYGIHLLSRFICVLLLLFLYIFSILELPCTMVFMSFDKLNSVSWIFDKCVKK